MLKFPFTPYVPGSKTNRLKIVTNDNTTYLVDIEIPGFSTLTRETETEAVIDSFCNKGRIKVGPKVYITWQSVAKIEIVG
jgi:hypothetical protein